MGRVAAARTLESDFQAALMRALGAPRRSTRVWRQSVGAPLWRDEAGKVLGKVASGAPNGAADLTGVVSPEGWRLEVEVKVKAPWTREQQAFERAIERAGGLYVLVRWVDGLDLQGNVAQGVAKVDAAVEARRFSR